MLLIMSQEQLCELIASAAAAAAAAEQ